MPAIRQVEINQGHYLGYLKREPVLEKIVKADLYQLTYEMLNAKVTAMIWKADIIVRVTSRLIGLSKEIIKKN
ncbi:hypothetical protein K040078D81_36540 [Blautia hominis]|uniref:Uncharacterized protein n=1 Tax=Blautia hominis TaxID=2025493 RepID=A0ABQ0BDL2_9FIRM